MLRLRRARACLCVPRPSTLGFARACMRLACLVLLLSFPPSLLLLGLVCLLFLRFLFSFSVYALSSSVSFVCSALSWSFTVMFVVCWQEASITCCDLFWPCFGQEMPEIISLYDVLGPLRRALLASRDVIFPGQICGSKLRNVFTLGEGC